LAFYRLETQQGPPKKTPELTPVKTPRHQQDDKNGIFNGVKSFLSKVIDNK
jgi:hypothetical protein